MSSGQDQRPRTTSSALRAKCRQSNSSNDCRCSV